MGISTNSLDAHFLRSFMTQHRSGGLEEARISRCAPGFSDEIFELRKLAGVAIAEAAVKARVAARSSDVLKAFAMSQTVIEAGVLGQEFIKLASGDLD